MCIAVPLYIMGYRHVELGSPFLSFLRNCNDQLNEFKIAIPEIPDVPKPPSNEGWFLVLNVLIDAVNFIVAICNIAISIMNAIIQFLQFIFIMIKSLINFKDDLAATGTSSSSNPFPVYTPLV